MWDNCSLTFSHLRSSDPPPHPPTPENYHSSKTGLPFARTAAGCPIKTGPLFFFFFCFFNNELCQKTTKPGQASDPGAARRISAAIKIRPPPSKLFFVTPLNSAHMLAPLAHRRRSKNRPRSGPADERKRLARGSAPSFASVTQRKELLKCEGEFLEVQK